MKALYFFIILLGFALFLGGCGRQVKSNKKNNAKLKKLVSPPLLEGIAVPFESVIEQENNEKSVLTDKSSDAVFMSTFPSAQFFFWMHIIKILWNKLGGYCKKSSIHVIF
jgi:hypothetical protein